MDEEAHAVVAVAPAATLEALSRAAVVPHESGRDDEPDEERLWRILLLPYAVCGHRVRGVPCRMSRVLWREA